MLTKDGCVHRNGVEDKKDDGILVRDRDGEAVGRVCPCRAAELVTKHGAVWAGPRRRRCLSLPVSLPDAQEETILDERAAARVRRGIEALGRNIRYLPPGEPRDPLMRPRSAGGCDASRATVGALLAGTLLTRIPPPIDELRRMREKCESGKYGGC